MRPGCSKCYRQSTPRLPVLASLWLVVILSGVVLAWSPGSVQAARQPWSGIARRASGMPPSPPAPHLSASPPPGSTPGMQATVPVTASLPSAPTVTPTATLIPLPVITFVQDGSTPTAVLLASVQRPAGTGFPKDPAPAWRAFLRRWSVPLLLLAVWTGLAVWLVGLLALAARSSNR